MSLRTNIIAGTLATMVFSCATKQPVAHQKTEDKVETTAKRYRVGFKKLPSMFYSPSANGGKLYSEKDRFYEVSKVNDTTYIEKDKNPYTNLLWDIYDERLIQASNTKPVYVFQADPNSMYNPRFEIAVVNAFSRAYKNTNEKPDIYYITPEEHPDISKPQSCIRGIYKRQVKNNAVFAPTHDQYGNFNTDKLTQELMQFFAEIDPTVKLDPVAVDDQPTPRR